MVRGPRPSRKGTGRGRRGDADSGAEETRTPDVLLAKEVLYQLSYGPKRSAFWGRRCLLTSEASEQCSGLGPSRRSRLKITAGVVQSNACGRFWTRTRGLCLIRAVL